MISWFSWSWQHTFWVEMCSPPINMAHYNFDHHPLQPYVLNVSKWTWDQRIRKLKVKNWGMVCSFCNESYVLNSYSMLLWVVWSLWSKFFTLLFISTPMHSVHNILGGNEVSHARRWSSGFIIIYNWFSIRVPNIDTHLYLYIFGIIGLGPFFCVSAPP